MPGPRESRRVVDEERHAQRNQRDGGLPVYREEGFGALLRLRRERQQEASEKGTEQVVAREFTQYTSRRVRAAGVRLHLGPARPPSIARSPHRGRKIPRGGSEFQGR